jgi:hypothetical protein
MATLLIIIASSITGIAVGWGLTLVVASRAMSRSQEHMEKKVRYWQARAGQPRGAGQAGREPTTPDYWPGALTDRATWARAGYDPAASDR